MKQNDELVWVREGGTQAKENDNRNFKCLTMNIGDSERKKTKEKVYHWISYSNINILFEINVKIDSLKEDKENKRIYHLPVFFDLFL